jgi:hypothetical protein
MSLLNWSTYQSLPPLRSYAAALAHFNKVEPIRGDKDGTKPAGRRDQKWLSIYMRDDKAVCIGSTWHKGQGRAMLEYHPDGRVVIGMQISASCRERIRRIAGLNINRHYNEDWVHAVSHVDGEEVIGQYPLQLRYNNPRKAVFVLREHDTPIYLNPTPTYKHIMNKQEKAKLTKQYKPFMQYVEVMAKLSADDTQYSEWSKESRDNPRLPTIPPEERREMGLPQHGSLRWTPEGPPQLISLVESGDTESWYKAMAWLTAGRWRVLLNEARLELTHTVHKHYRDVLFTKERVEAGKCVHDRYGRYFR